jgi:hypothetical protein
VMSNAVNMAAATMGMTVKRRTRASWHSERFPHGHGVRLRAGDLGDRDAARKVSSRQLVTT